MKKTIAGAVAILAVAALAACSGGLTQSSILPSQSQSIGPMSRAMSPYELLLMQAPRYRACPQATRPGEFTCFAIFSNVVLPENMTTNGSSCLHQPGCYGPSDLQAAYGITSAAKTGGKNMTVAIVDAYGYPKAKSDLVGYRKFFKLSAAKLTIVNQKGQTKPLPKPNAGWDGEQALDLDMVSAICPNCKILLVQANSSSGSDLTAGVATALRMANVVTNSWGGPEVSSTYPTFDNHPGHVVTASAGDGGVGAGYGKGGAQEPCAFQGVVCVGGTSLTLNSGSRVNEVVWNGLSGPHECSTGPCATGSGCSLKVPKPSWQKSVSSVNGCKMRNESDVSADADPFTGVVIAFGGKLLGGAGGTSASSPMIAAMYALAGNTSSATPATLWAKGSTGAFHDITSGTNSRKGVTYVCPASFSYICKARAGYDGPTGWGTPNGLGAL